MSGWTGSRAVRTAAAALCALAVTGLGCAGSGQGQGSGGRVATGFPERATLDRLAAAPAPDVAEFTLGYRDAGEWDLSGPFPDVVDLSPREGDLPWDGLVDRIVASRAGLVVASEGMECFAREAGSFLVEHDALPGLGLQRFFAGRCGVATGTPQLFTLNWTTPVPYSLDQAIAELDEQIDGHLRERVVGGPLDVGLWMTTGADRVDLVVATGKRLVRVDPVPTTPRDGRVVLRGEVLTTARGIEALVTRGRLAWNECEADGNVRLPRFAITCQVDPDDRTAWVSLALYRHGSILGRTALEVLVRPRGDPVRGYRRHAYTGPRPVDGPEAMSSAFLEVLNAVRGEADAPPLVYEVEQSATATEVAPHYFQALMDPAAERAAEVVALGMMAGWEVDALVQEGRFTSMWLIESGDVASMLSDALEFPSVRRALLAPETARLAVGPLSIEEEGVRAIAAIAATYRLFSESDHRKHAAYVHDRLAVARVERKRLIPREIDRVRPLALDAARRVQAGLDPKQALGDWIEETVQVLGRSVTGWYAEVQDLDEIVFPDSFLDPRRLEVSISVALRRPPDEPWGRYVVMMVGSEPEARRL
ncbi:MAG: hypothetical protein ACQGVC_21335 [Myxococcota bacterium]